LYFCVIDGQAIAIKLSKQITQKTNAIKATVTKYNASLDALEQWVRDLPTEITFEQAKDPNSQLYAHLHLQHTSDTIPFAVKRSAIDLHQFLLRCKGEQQLLILEVERLFKHYIEKKVELHTICKSVAETRLDTGAVAIAKKELAEINNMLFTLCSQLSMYSNVENVNSDVCAAIEAEHALLKPYAAYDADCETVDSSAEHSDDEELLDLSDQDSDCEYED
jgi:hypothetical protein